MYMAVDKSLQVSSLDFSLEKSADHGPRIYGDLFLLITFHIAENVKRTTRRVHIVISLLLLSKLDC